MRGGHGDDHDELVGGVPVHDLLPQVETLHVGEHIHSEFSTLGCQGLNMVLLNLFPGPPEGRQPLLVTHPWMVRGGSGE